MKMGLGDMHNCQSLSPKIAWDAALDAFAWCSHLWLQMWANWTFAVTWHVADRAIAGTIQGKKA